MAVKSDVHETLSLMFQRDRVPPRIAFDNSKERSLGQFATKYKEADCHLTNTLPYSPWMQAAEGYILQYKQGPSKMMSKQNVPMKVWDHSIEM